MIPYNDWTRFLLSIHTLVKKLRSLHFQRWQRLWTGHKVTTLNFKHLERRQWNWLSDVIPKVKIVKLPLAHPAFKLEDSKASSTSCSLARCTLAIRGQDLNLQGGLFVGFCMEWWKWNDAELCIINADYADEKNTASFVTLIRKPNDHQVAWSSKAQAILAVVRRRSSPGRTSLFSGYCP